MCEMFDEYCTPCGEHRTWQNSTLDQRNEFLEKEFGLQYWHVVHARADKIKNIFEGKNWDFNDYIKITSTRNPWARIVSLYVYLLHERRWEAWRVPADEMESFPTFVKTSLRNWQGGPYRWNTYEMTHDDDGNQLVDYVVRLEHLEEDLSCIVKKHFPTFSIDYNIKMNNTTHDHYSTYYDDRTKSIVSDVFAYDIEEWGYKFEDVK
jgi:hypothetical protein